MDNWTLLKKELDYYNIKLVSHNKCKVIGDDGSITLRGLLSVNKDIEEDISHNKKILLSLWDETLEMLSDYDYNNYIIDERMIKLFIFSLKDMLKYLLCFDECEKTEYYKVVYSSLSRDINSFSKAQIYGIPNLKIAIDWVSRNISILYYVSKLLKFASDGPKRVSQYNFKAAAGIAGPWSRLDLPMEERKMPFGTEVQEREKAKQKQRRYNQGLQNYNNDGRVGEGYYYRELRNEPFSWKDRGSEDPYPSRSYLSGRG